MLFPPFTLIDLTHSLNSSIPAWDSQETFNLSTSLDYTDCTTPVKFRVQHIECPAGIGTHMDAPSHCVPGGATIADLPLEQLCAPCVVIDLSERAYDASPFVKTSGDRYVVSADDIRAFEAAHGTIQQNSFVIIRTGWDKLWNAPERYRNNLVFPSVSIEAAQLLLERDIMGLGVDTLSPDSAPTQTGASPDALHHALCATRDKKAMGDKPSGAARPSNMFPVHHLLLSAGKIIVENVANADRMPATGAWCLIAPLKIAGGTESPIRLIGIVPHRTNSDIANT